MPEITALFWDVGGVLLTNAWDRNSRRRAVEHFKLDGEDYEDRHGMIVSRLETGRLTLDNYLDRTIFYRPREFTRDEFKAFMYGESKPIEGTLSLLDRLARSRKYLIGTLNNESRELNLYRIERFGLRKYFDVFFSSCFLGVKKPDDEIYRLALDLSQRQAGECIFIDDRGLNLERASHSGMHTIRFQNAAQLERELQQSGVELPQVSTPRT